MIRRLLQPNMVRRSMALPTTAAGAVVSPGHPKGLKLQSIAGSWNFSTPATSIPATAGNCVYADNAPGALRISEIDQSAFHHQFVLVRAGDVFTIGTASFTVSGPGIFSSPEWIFPGTMTGTIPADGILTIQVTRP